MKRLHFAFLFVVVWSTSVAVCLTSQASYERPELEQVPVETLLDNLERLAADDPENVTFQMNLGRVHAMAWVQAEPELKIRKNARDEFADVTPFFGFAPANLPFWGRRSKPVENADNERQAHLDQAAGHFQRALDLQPDNLVARLSLAWCLDQRDDTMEAIDAYRQVVAAAWEKENEMNRFGLGYRSVTVEAAGYLKLKLDPESDAEEIADLNRKIETIRRKPRPITPIAIPLGEQTTYPAVFDPGATVAFDADGTDSGKTWTWIRPTAGWLVFDQKGQGQIDSALQMFGNVTFWCFWEDGYQAMRALDHNGDNLLTGRELQHLAIWQDANSNGISEHGEVRPLDQHGIVGLHCRPQASNVDALSGSSEILQHSRGVIYADGSTRPSFDVILRSVSESQPNSSSKP